MALESLPPGYGWVLLVLSLTAILHVSVGPGLVTRGG